MKEVLFIFVVFLFIAGSVKKDSHGGKNSSLLKVLSLMRVIFGTVYQSASLALLIAGIV